MQEWLLAHDPVAAAQQSPAEFERSLVVPGNPMRRPESRRAFDLWRTALTVEHRATGWLGERQGYAEFVRARLPLGRRERAGRQRQLRRDTRPAGRAAAAGPLAVRFAGAGGAAPARRRLRDGLGGAVGAARRTAGGGGRRLVARARLPARARAPVPRGAGRRPGRLPLAGPRVPAGPDHRQRRVRGRRPCPQPCPGAARRRTSRPSGCPRGSMSSRPSATWRSRRSTWVPPPTPTRGSTASR